MAYYLSVKAGNRSINDVPEKYRKAVQEMLNEGTDET